MTREASLLHSPKSPDVCLGFWTHAPENRLELFRVTICLRKPGDQKLVLANRPGEQSKRKQQEAFQSMTLRVPSPFFPDPSSQETIKNPEKKKTQKKQEERLNIIGESTPMIRKPAMDWGLVVGPPLEGPLPVRLKPRKGRRLFLRLGRLGLASQREAGRGGLFGGCLESPSGPLPGVSF